MRRSPLKSRRSTPRRSGRVRHQEMLEWTKSQPCLLSWRGECYGPTEADHAGKRPLGRKCSDTEVIPLCTKHHRERTDYRGYFAGFDGAGMRAWCDLAISEMQSKARRAGVLAEEDA